MLWQTAQQAGKYWPRAIILVDMNAFFASVEQLDHPEWRGRALAVTNGKQGTCVITSSYEARAFGIKTGMRLDEAKRLCPDLIQVPAHPERYVQVSRAIMEALASLTPDMEIFSIDEAFLDVTRCQSLFGTPEAMGLMARELVFKASGLLCSVGVSGDKTTAKFAAKQRKPNGFTVIPPWQSKERLKHVLVTELCGIKSGIGGFLARHGVLTCGDMEKVPISVLAKRFGNLGRRIWYMCQGADPDPVHTQVASPKSMGHGKVMPPGTRDMHVVETYLMHMCEKLASRLRHHHFHAQHFFAGLRSREFGWLGGVGQTLQPTNDGREIFQLGSFLLAQRWEGESVCQIQVTALDPGSGGLQLDFFTAPDIRRCQINDVVDDINDRFGEFTIGPAPLLFRSATPNVIAPAWKPDGHRQTI
ncbi:DNA polymerase IV [Aquicella siphonis]|uniref:DNA polymerase IV n=2 Tax=Aquicella siphonis TaxID=254247 RepID=A0A5E4PGW3_9COXI|nr:DNA polymerase IV [Aquicella siphonis]